ncbi:hypothetical protein F4777DRAFT_297237 [Nemania sp. FL0916]|nr:hypothetical protein F4777DRAFT_297237 [Nemania sp. FL0916]
MSRYCRSVTSSMHRFARDATIGMMSTTGTRNGTNGVRWNCSFGKEPRPTGDGGIGATALRRILAHGHDQSQRQHTNTPYADMPLSVGLGSRWGSGMESREGRLAWGWGWGWGWGCERGTTRDGYKFVRGRRERGESQLGSELELELQLELKSNWDLRLALTSSVLSTVYLEGEKEQEQDQNRESERGITDIQPPTGFLLDHKREKEGKEEKG